MSVTSGLDYQRQSRQVGIGYDTELLGSRASAGVTEQFFRLIRDEPYAATYVVNSGHRLLSIRATHGKDVGELIEESGIHGITLFLEMLRDRSITPNWPAAFQIANHHVNLAERMLMLPPKSYTLDGLNVTLRDITWNRWEDLRGKVPSSGGIMTRFHSPSYL